MRPARHAAPRGDRGRESRSCCIDDAMHLLERHLHCRRRLIGGEHFGTKPRHDNNPSMFRLFGCSGASTTAIRLYRRALWIDRLEPVASVRRSTWWPNNAVSKTEMPSCRRSIAEAFCITNCQGARHATFKRTLHGGDLPEHGSSIHVDCGTVDKAGRVRTQEKDRGGHVAGLAHATHGQVCGDTILHRLVDMRMHR